MSLLIVETDNAWLTQEILKGHYLVTGTKTKISSFCRLFRTVRKRGNQNQNVW